MAASPSFLGTPAYGRQTIANADGTSTKDLFTAGASGSQVQAIMITTDETAARDLKIYIYDGTNTDLIGVVNVPIGAGNTSGVLAVNALDKSLLPWLPDDKVITLKAGFKIKIAAGTAVTSGKTITVVALGGDF
jgi:hypothetical protein